ncbi:hypothetical protein JL720_17210 [Aureococcus anophagefferens]|nr:hypothetical protein JL720_17210 [Aureococcus anophagefferens]
MTTYIEKTKTLKTSLSTVSLEGEAKVVVARVEQSKTFLAKYQACGVAVALALAVAAASHARFDSRRRARPGAGAGDDRRREIAVVLMQIIPDRASMLACFDVDDMAALEPVLNRWIDGALPLIAKIDQFYEMNG